MILDTQDPFEADPIVIGGEEVDDPIIPAMTGITFIEGGVHLHDAIRELFDHMTNVDRTRVKLPNCRIRIEWDDE